MSKRGGRRIILVFRKTRLQELIERFNTWPQAKFYLSHNQVDSQDYLVEHDLYQQQLTEAEKLLKPLAPFQKLERNFLPNYRFTDNDLVIVIGQDGLVANVIKYLSGQPVIAVNPDPSRWDGVLLPFEMGDLLSKVKQCLSNEFEHKSITLAEANTNDGQRMLAVNDLFIGPQSHTSARYKIYWGKHQEIQSSSGIIVSTGFGSSGWFQSILAGAIAVTGSKGHKLSKGFEWNEKRLQFSVREPFPSNTTSTELVFGAIRKKQNLQIESYMPEKGVIFSDGIEADFINFNSGTIVDIGVSNTCGSLVV